MRLLILTQVIDIDDPVLGFFHNWVKELAKEFESIHVICLKKGAHDLPGNVHVYSLGKENHIGRIAYLRNFFRLVISLRHMYDSVFVHMNQEYILLAGLFWKFAGKPIYMWRNHHSGSLLTDGAAFFCTHIFCTSKFSYTAKYAKTIFMPVGIDTNIFYPRTTDRSINKLLFIARIAPTKNLHLIVEALLLLKERGHELELGVYGGPLPKDQEYMNALEQKVQKENLHVVFHGPVKNTDTPFLYSNHDICINMSSSGMYDKTIFEAMACECLSVASNKNLEGQIDKVFVIQQGDSIDLAAKLEQLIKLSQEQKDAYRAQLRQFAVENHSLQTLVKKIHSVLS